MLEGSEQTQYLELEVLSELYDISQELRIEAGARRYVESLVHGWQRLSVEVPAGTERIELEANRLFPKAYYPDDPRELAVRIGIVEAHQKASRHQATHRNQANNVLNMREMLEGRTELESTPFTLGIDPHGICNIKPPCVYCLWDEEKKLEGELVDAPFDTDTLEDYGNLYLGASQLLSCCIGEPFMMRNLGSLLDRFAADGKVLEMSTNGQILTDKQIEHLVGRPIRLYVSVDAATAQTYARLRNRHFDRVIENIQRLSRAKGGRGRLPHVFLVFMPIRANLHELDAFVQLCAELDVDRLALRALDPAEHNSLRSEREGHVFDYHAQRLPLKQLACIADRAQELCQRAGVPFSNQLDFGAHAVERFTKQPEAGPREVESEGGAGHEGNNAAATTPEGTNAPEPEVSVPGVKEPAVPAFAEAVAESVPEMVAEADAMPLPTLGQERLPLCCEPWRNFNILRRGVLPCCYGGFPLASMHEHQEAWNGETLQAIRAALAAGRFHDYCLRSPSCPVVNHRELTGGLDPGMRRWLGLRRVWHRLNRHTGGFPHRLVRPVLHVLVPALRTLLGQGRNAS
jgi:organic radical activating enzyme